MIRPMNILDLKKQNKLFEIDIRKEERNKTIDEIIAKLTDAIDDRTRTFKGLHAAIKIVDKLRKTPEQHCIGDCKKVSEVLK